MCLSGKGSQAVICVFGKVEFALGMVGVTYEFDVRRRWVVVAYHIQPPSRESEALLGEVFRDPRFEDDMNILLDRTAITEPPSRDYVETMVRFVDAHQSPGRVRKWAIVTSRDVLFGMGRMAEQLTQSSGSIRAFRSRAEAEQWLREK